MLIKHHEEYDIFYADKGDPFVYTEQRPDYGPVAPRAEGKNVLDFGAHCGYFNVFVSRLYPPAKITSIEPDPQSLAVLKKNARPDTTIIHAAVVDASCPDKTLPLYLGKTYRSKNSLEPYRGRATVDVPTVKFQDVIKDIHFLKCDCEGGEHQFEWRRLPRMIETIAIEFHFRRPGWYENSMSIHETLLKQGFTAVRAPKQNTFRKVSKGLYVR